MTVYKSDKLLNSLQKELKIKFTAKQRSVMQKVVREYFIQVHREACESTLISFNRKSFRLPNYHD